MDAIISATLPLYEVVDMTLQQTAALLIDKPGSLAYFLILAMALALVFSLANLYQRPESTSKRWITVTAVLLGTHLLFMILTGLNWFDVIGPQILPSMDRFNSLYSLVLLSTALVIRREKAFKRVFLLSTILMIVLLAGSVFATSGMQSTANFNQTWIDAVWSLSGLALGVVILIGIILSRAPLWPLTILPVALLTAGFGLHMRMGSDFGSMAAMVRLAEICAFPLFALLASRTFALPLQVPVKENQKQQDSSAWNSMMSAVDRLNAAHNNDFQINLIIDVADAMTTTFQADICLILTAPTANGRFSIATGYNQLQKREVPESPLSASTCPNLYEAMSRRKSFLLPDARQLADTSTLEKNLRRALKGPMMFAPFHVDSQVFGGALLLTPVRKHQWEDQDRKSLEILADLIANRLQRLTARADTQPPFTHLNEEKLNEIEEEIIHLREVLENASDTTRDIAEKREGLLEKYRSSRINLLQVNEEVQQLRKTLDSARVQYNRNVSKHQELQQEYEQTAIRLEQQEKENSRYRRALASLNEQQERLREFETVSAGYEQARLKLQSLEAEQNRLREALNVARSKYLVDLEKQRRILTQYRSAQARITTLEEETEGLKSALSREEQEAEEKSRRLAAELRMVLQELSETRSRLAELQDKTGEAGQTREEIVEEFFSLLQSLQKPLSSMKGYASLLMGESVGLLGTMQRKFLERIQASIDDINSLLEEQAALPEAAAAATPVEGCDLRSSIAEAAEELEPEISARNLTLEIDLPERLPRIRCVPLELHNALKLLLLHAVLGSNPEEEISVAAVPQTGGAEAFILFSIADRGNGIPREDLEQIFTPGYNHNRNGDGLLNLADVKTFCEKSGGKIWMDSQVGRGSTVSLLLPVFSP